MVVAPRRYAAVAQALSSAARKLQTRPARLRLATLATRLVAGENVFDKVLGGAQRGCLNLAEGVCGIYDSSRAVSGQPGVCRRE